MKIRAYDIKINDREQYDNEFKMRMFLPAESEYPKLIGWMQECSMKPATESNALYAYIRTELFMNNEITFKMQFVFDNDRVALPADEDYIADITDSQYDSYRRAMVSFRYPTDVIVDIDNLIFKNYNMDEIDIEHNVWELLMQSLPLFNLDFKYE